MQPDPRQKSVSDHHVGREMVGQMIDQSGLPEVAAKISRELDADGIIDPKVRSQALVAGLKAAMTPTWGQRIVSVITTSAFWFWLIAAALVAFSIYVNFTK